MHLEVLFSAALIEPDYLVGRDPPMSEKASVGRYRTPDPNLHGDVGQRHARCRADDSDHPPGAAQLEDDVLSLHHVERQRVWGQQLVVFM